MGQLVFQATLGGQVNLVGPNTASTFNLNVPATSSTIATLTGTETFTNKTLTSPTLTTPVLGTPSSGTLTNCTGLPNAGLVNSSVTVGSTAISLGGTATTVAGLTSLATNTLTSAASTALTLQSAGTTAVTIDTSQNFMVNTTTPQSTSAGRGNITLGGSSSAIFNLSIAGANSGSIYHSGTEMWMLNSANGPNLFFTNGTERMRIDSSGNLLVGTTSNLSGVNGFQVSKNAGATSYAGAIVNTKTDNATVTNGFLVKYTGVSPSDGNYMFLCQDSGNTNRFYVTNAGGTGGTSDANLKKNIETTRDGYAEDLCKIRIVKYNWKEQSDDTPKDLGWIAQEVEQVFPRMIKTDADTGIKSVTHSAFVPMLIKAIQELKAINDTQAETINALTARVVALEAK